MMNGISSERKVLKIALILLTIISMNSILAFADGITMDGTIDEAEWNYWFKDDSDSPVVDVYHYNDTSNVYIGLLTDDTTDNDDSLEFAFRASRRDYWFMLKSDGSAWWRSGEEGVEGWWNGMNTGLPAWINAVVSMTDGKRSYEISITLTCMEEKAYDSMTDGKRSYEISITLTCMEEKAYDFPDKLVFWYKVQNENPGGPNNFYPNSLAGWWFVLGQYPDGEGGPLDFAVPELPLGTIMALISMFAAIAIFAKRTSILQLRR